MNLDRGLVELSVRHLLYSIGEDISRDGLKDTPRRITDMLLNEIAKDSSETLADVLDAIFTEDSVENTMVKVSDVPISSWCEHHMLPFFGTCSVTYVPDGHVLGLSKVARLAKAATRGLTIQERITNQMADALHAKMEAVYVSVTTEMMHTCMIARGVQSYGSLTTVRAIRGAIPQWMLDQERMSR